MTICVPVYNINIGLKNIQEEDNLYSPNRVIDNEYTLIYKLKNTVFEGNSKAIRTNNPGNIVSFTTGKHRVFYSMYDGYIALFNQIKLYQSGKSIHTTDTTRLKKYASIYAKSENYYILLSLFCNVSYDSYIKDIPIDSLIKAHIRIEDGNLYRQLYRNTKTKRIK